GDEVRRGQCDEHFRRRVTRVGQGGLFVLAHEGGVTRVDVDGFRGVADADPAGDGGEDDVRPVVGVRWHAGPRRHVHSQQSDVRPAFVAAEDDGDGGAVGYRWLDRKSTRLN